MFHSLGHLSIGASAGLSLAFSAASAQPPLPGALLGLAFVALLVGIVCHVLAYRAARTTKRAARDPGAERIEAALRTVHEKKGNDDMPISETTYWTDNRRPYRVAGDIPLRDDQEIRILDGIYRVDFIDVHPRTIPGERGGKMQMVKDVYVTLVSREFWPY